MKLIASTKYSECVLLGKKTMTSYFEANNIPWYFDERLELYKALELYEVFDRSIIGFVAFRVKEQELYLADIQVYEKYQNRGYGTKILKEAKKIAKDRDHKCIMLKVFKSSPAIRLYERNGFSRIAEEEFLYVLQSNT